MSNVGSGTGHYLEVVRFGEWERVEVTPGDVITFPQGLVGMGDRRRFALLDDPRIAPCRWLQSIDDPALAFVVVEPRLVVPDYEAGVSGDDAQQLELRDARDGDLWAIVTVDADPARSTVNLLAPVVVNPQQRLGRQIILDGSGYSLRHPVAAVEGGANGEHGEHGESDMAAAPHPAASRR
ncbi:MAG: flagellar assembly protein FliW [Chloroflexota bacterium]